MLLYQYLPPPVHRLILFSGPVLDGLHPPLYLLLHNWYACRLFNCLTPSYTSCATSPLTAPRLHDILPLGNLTGKGYIDFMTTDTTQKESNETKKENVGVFQQSKLRLRIAEDTNICSGIQLVHTLDAHSQCWLPTANYGKPNVSRAHFPDSHAQLLSCKGIRHRYKRKELLKDFEHRWEVLTTSETAQSRKARKYPGGNDAIT